MPIRSQMSSIIGQLETEYPKLFALEFGKIAESDFVYTLASTNIYQSAQKVLTCMFPSKTLVAMATKLKNL